MANQISLSASMRTNLLSLQNTSLLTDMTQGRLSTGKKVNSALDNPSAFFTSQALNNRASDLSSRLDGIGQSLQALKAADASLTSLTKLVENAKALAQQASEAVTAAGLLSSQEVKDVADLSLTASATAVVGTTMSVAFASVTAADSITITINGGTTRTVQISNAVDVSTQIQNINAQLQQDGVTAYWDNTNKTIEFAAKKGTTLQISEVGAGTNGAAVFGAGRIGAANTYTFSAPAATDLAIRAFDGLAGNDSFTMKVYDSTGASTVATITVAATDTISAVVDKLNAVSSGNVTASFNTTTNRLEFTGKAGYQVEFGELTTNAASEIFGGSKVGSTNKVTFGDATGNATVTKNLADFKTVMDNIDSLVQDASYKGKNLLKGSDSMTVLFNEDGSSKLTVQGVNFTHEDGLGFTKNTQLAWANMGQIQASIDQAKAATDTIRAQAAKFGTANSVISTREEFTKNMVDTLKSGADKLVLADMNEEAANMLALQTQRSLATNSLTMASQAAQSVLQLFR